MLVPFARRKGGSWLSVSRKRGGKAGKVFKFR
ncbi:hypothetical protein BM590_A0361 [Brucella melitensis M5-90]|nr:hypothetical protein BM590_A0361 [Brucella melitensis M5-90]